MDASLFRNSQFCIEDSRLCLTKCNDYIELIGAVRPRQGFTDVDKTGFDPDAVLTHRDFGSGFHHPFQESDMKINQVLALSALALVTGAALADETPLTRAEVRDDVIAARAAGTLFPAGQGTQLGYATSAAPTVSRAQVKAEASQVYAAKQRSIPTFESAGNNTGALDYARASTAPSTLTRIERKEATLAARSRGELMRAGEGGYPAVNADIRATNAPARDLFAAFRNRR